jgi:hypothetical protein
MNGAEELGAGLWGAVRQQELLQGGALRDYLSVCHKVDAEAFGPCAVFSWVFWGYSAWAQSI